MPDAAESRERRHLSAAEATWALWDLLRAGEEVGLALAARLGLPANDARALDLLAGSAQPLGPVELGHRLGIRSASATELVDRLARAGHVHRVHHPRDRRRVVVEVTDSGRETVLAVLAPMLARFDRVAAESGAPQEVVAYLRAVAGQMRAFAAEPSPEPDPETQPGAGTVSMG